MLLDLIKENQINNDRLVNGIKGFFSGRYEVHKTAEYDLFEVKPLTKEGNLTRDANDVPVVYYVKPHAKTCTCLDFKENKVPVCKHIVMATLAQDLWLQRTAQKVYNKNKVKEQPVETEKPTVEQPIATEELATEDVEVEMVVV